MANNRLSFVYTLQYLLLCHKTTKDIFIIYKYVQIKTLANNDFILHQTLE